ncbi:MAG: rhodanese-like domain-containing protein [candidate division Zixibacteria bacterium]|nr:rhodanese-like domain-containing protein [candidate division Zixibacteria bacterium]MDH3935923.1 rhodanese-like domain-containing protein [candidate division Zixibacteria bacterium]MDH4034336.1 rhodanese-like domain-containing protein [candidate division Zixibacteria bacterium]
MYFKNPIIVLIAILTWTFAQAQVKSAKQIVEETEAQIEQISIDELKTKIDSDQEFILIDVRTEKEYLAGHVEGAVWIPSGKVKFATQKITEDPNVDIVIYCRARGQSALSVYALDEIGYEKVFNLDGGFKEWVNAGNSVFNMHGEIKVISFEEKEE